MSDVALARDLVIKIAGHWQTIDDLIERVYRSVAVKHSTWTRRRIRAIWNNEAASIKFHEMRELYAAASKAKEDQVRIEEARREHAEFINKTASIVALLEHQDSSFHSPQIAALGGLSH